MSWSPGDVVALREIWRGRVWEARPAIVVRDDPELRMFYVAPGNRSQVAVGPDGVQLRLLRDEWRLAEVQRLGHHVLSFASPDSAHAVLSFSDQATKEFLGWYVNLQAPLQPSRLGFDTTDHVLDVLIPPDRSTWTWKDEDELEEAVALGIFTSEQAEAFRAEGERAARAIIERQPPFDEPWEGWHPDPEWPSPELPESWEVVEPERAAPDIGCSEA